MSIFKKKTVLLTGATGFVGSHLLGYLLKEGCNVIVLKRSTSDTYRIDQLINGVRVYDSDQIPLEEVFESNSIDSVVHLATLYRKFDNGKEISEMINSNITYPIELLELSVRYGVKSFINTGTFFEVDCSSMPLSESASKKPFNLYAKTKIAFEEVLSSYAEKICIKTLRLFSPYGEKDNDKLIPMIIQKSLSDEEIKLSEGFQKLDFIYVHDVAKAFVKAIDLSLTKASGYDIYNIGSGQPVSIREIVSVIEEILGRSINKKWGEPSTVDVPIVYSDIGKAKSDLTWAPEYTLKEGLRNTIQFYIGLKK